MKDRIIASIVITAAAALFIAGSAAAAPTSTPVQNLIITQVKNAPCLSTDMNGLVGSTSCGTGGGGGSSTVLFGVSPIVVTTLSNGNQTSSCPTCLTTSTGLTTANFSSANISQWTNNSGYVTSTGVATNTGNWAGTWQGNSPSAFQTALGFTPYNATNPNGYISSLTGALLIANNLSDLTNTSTARTNLGLGSIATHPTTDYLPSSTIYSTVSTSSANTWSQPQAFNGITNTGSVTSTANIQTATINEPIATSSATTSSTVVNWALSNKQWVQLNVATTSLVFSNVQNGASYTLWLLQNATGSETVAWPTTGIGRIQWASSTVPTLTTTANNMDVFSFQCFAPATTSTLSCYGQYGAGNFTQ